MHNVLGMLIKTEQLGRLFICREGIPVKENTLLVVPKGCT